MRWVLGFCLMAMPVLAEEADYGEVWLTGLARDVDWPLNTVGESSVMVCNVNGPDGYLSVRAGPGTDFAVKRNLGRLVILTVDTRQRRGNWVRVLDAYRNTDKDGNTIPFTPVSVDGWAHDGYMCAFVH